MKVLSKSCADALAAARSVHLEAQEEHQLDDVDEKAHDLDVDPITLLSEGYAAAMHGSCQILGLNQLVVALQNAELVQGHRQHVEHVVDERLLVGRGAIQANELRHATESVHIDELRNGTLQVVTDVEGRVVRIFHANQHSFADYLGFRQYKDVFCRGVPLPNDVAFLAEVWRLKLVLNKQSDDGEDKMLEQSTLRVD